MKAKDKRSFPFVPPSTLPKDPTKTPEKPKTASGERVTETVDLSPFVLSAMQVEGGHNNAGDKLLNAFRQDGFAIVTEHWASHAVYVNALKSCSKFFTAPEYVRRSALAKIYARRGYSPSCSENFASLIGNAAPNDAVKKFRIGPPIGHGNEADGSNSETFLLQPNIWPSGKGLEGQRYRRSRSRIPKAILRSIIL